MAGDTRHLTRRVLVAGVGNIFLGDDGFGPQVARRLSAMDLPQRVRVTDYGISGMHLAYDIAEGYDTTIVIDAAASGGEPGSVVVTEVDGEYRHDRVAGTEPSATPLFDAHGMQPDVVFGVLDMLGARAGRIIVVGCEPASIDCRIGLSEPVEAAVDQAVTIIMDLIATTGPSPAPPPGSSPAPPPGLRRAPPAGLRRAPPAGLSSAPPPGLSPAPPAGLSPAPPAGFSPLPSPAAAPCGHSHFSCEQAPARRPGRPAHGQLP